jgi:hypothetical protein
MQRIALKLLLAIALVLQGAGAFGTAFYHAACCGHGEQTAQAHCRHCHGAPCKPDCARLCIGCTASALIAVPTYAAIASTVSVAAPVWVRASAYARDALPPTRPPIV